MEIEMINKKEVMSLMEADIGPDFSIKNETGGEPTMQMFSTSGSRIPEDLSYSKTPYTLTGWEYFQNYYYPYVIKESYPVYIQERAQDKGKQAFEILKILQDKGLLKVEKVSDFIEAMDALIKTL